MNCKDYDCRVRMAKKNTEIDRLSVFDVADSYWNVIIPILSDYTNYLNRFVGFYV